MKYLSEYEIFKLLENMDREYINIHQSSESPIEKKFSLKAHFVIGNVRKEFKKKIEDKNV